MLILAELVFVTRILGLTSGQHPLDIVVDGSVKRVQILQNGTAVATLRGPPWQAMIDFGTDIEPQTLTAVGYDVEGNEIARDTQIVNLARPPAELGLSLERDEASGRLRAIARWQHIGEVKSKRIEIKLDGKRIGTTDRVLLPALKGTAIHVLEAEVRFVDGITARKEIVFGGLYAEQVPTELTGVLVRRGPSGHTDLATCFRLGDETIRAAGIERSEALVVFVRDPDPRLAAKMLRADGRSAGVGRLLQDKTRYGMADVKLQVLWPVAHNVEKKGAGIVASLFDRTARMEGDFGTHWVLTSIGGPQGEEYRFTDALSVAGVVTLSGAHRRAVVMVVGDRHDDSRHDAGKVRRYLERVGVPLRVWSLVGAPPEITRTWGAVTDVSSPQLLMEATAELRRELASQWIVWMPAGPLEALDVSSVPDCAFTPVTRPSPRRSPSATPPRSPASVPPAGR